MSRGLAIARDLKKWTQRFCEQPDTRPGAAHETALRRLRQHAALHNTCVPFLSLPGRVLALICSYLSLSDRIVLSHLACDLRSRLVNVPGIWCNLALHNMLCKPYTSAALQELLRRSDPLPIQLTLWIDDENYVSILPTLSANVKRLSSLSLTLHTFDSTPECTSAGGWKSTLAALLNAAPILEELRVRAFEKFNFGEVDPASCHGMIRSPLHLPPSFLAGHALMLRTLVAESVRLPILPTGGAFAALTCFDIYLGYSGHILDLARVLHMLPALETLAIRAYFKEATLLDAIGPPAAARPANLRNLLLQLGCTRVSEALLCHILPLSTIRHLDLETRKPGRLVDAAYPRGFKTLVAGLSGYTLSVVNDTGAVATTIRMYDFPACCPYAISGLATVTWLALDELMWRDVMQVMPPLPAVAGLHIRLGSCQNVRNMAYRQGIFHLDPGLVWHLPLLKELAVSAPTACKADTRLCSCRGPMSVSLLDLAAFIRGHLTFEAAALDRVRLSGFSIIDPDFCSAWLGLRACAHDIDWVEHPDVIPHMDIPPLQAGFQADLRAHFSGRDL